MAKSRWKLLAKFLFSAALIVLLVRHYQVDGVIRQLAQADVPLALAAILLTVGMSLIHAWRWKFVITANGSSLGYANALRLLQIGYFFNQALPSSVGGDLVRVWQAHRHGMRLSVAFNSVVVDRLTALAGLLLIVAVSMPWLAGVIGSAYMRVFLATLLFAGLCGFGVLLFVDRLPEKYFSWRPLRALWQMSGFARRVFLDKNCLTWVLALSVITHMLVCLAVYLLAQALAISLTFIHCLMLVPLVMLVTMIPVSIAGWGVREGAMVVALGMVGVPASSAFSLSLLFGLVVAVASLPGAMIWMLGINNSKDLNDVTT